MKEKSRLLEIRNQVESSLQIWKWIRKIFCNSDGSYKSNMTDDDIQFIYKILSNDTKKVN
jgi:hypothetical protein